MYSSSLLTLLGAALFASQPALGNVDGFCPILGAVLPAPKNPSSHPAVQKALGELKAYIDQVVGPLKVSAVSVAVKSVHEDTPLLHTHYTPPALSPKGTQNIDATSVYRLGSISKIFPVLALLKLDGVSLDDKVTKYLPEIKELNKQAQGEKDALNQINWDEVTLGAVASHQAGIGRDFAVDYTAFPGYTDIAPKYGLPPKDKILLPGCAGIPPLLPCTKNDFFTKFGQRYPSFAPYAAPAYSNIGSSILAFVVEKVSGKSYPEFFKEKVVGPLGLNDTGAVPPKDLTRGVIPVNDTWFVTDIGHQTYGGGFYSTSDNMIAIADAILGNKLFSPALTRKWLKPMVNTASLGLQLGAPWEILRATSVTKDQRSIEIYTKDGDLFNYKTTLAMIPDYDLAFTVLVAGSAEMVQVVPTIKAAATKILLPAFEAASKEEAAREYAGIYTDPASNSTIVLEVDAADNGPGIKVAQLTVRGFDVLNKYPVISNRGDTKIPDPLPLVRLRLQPAVGLSTEKRESWRGVWTIGPPEAVAAKDEPFPWKQNSCLSWATTDALVYGLNALDHFIFYRNKYVHSARGIKSGMAESIEYPAFQVRLNKLPKTR